MLLVWLALFGENLSLGVLWPFYNRGWAVESFAMMRLAMHNVNNDPHILPQHNLSLEMYDTATSGNHRSSTALAGAIMHLQRPDVVGIIGTGYSVTVEAPSVYSSLVSKPIVCPASVSPSSALVYKQEIPFLVRSVVSQRRPLRGLVAACVDFGWRHVAVLTSQGSFGRDMWNVFQELAQTNNVHIAYYGNHPRQVSDAVQLDIYMSAMRLTRVRTIVVLSDFADVPYVLEALVRHNFLTDGFSVMLPGATRLSSILAAVNGNPGLLWLEPRAPSGLALSVQQRFNANYSSWTTVYNATLHGAWNATTKTPLYATDGPIWEFNDDGVPGFWAQNAYDAVWLYAHALDNITRRGIDPTDGEALKAQIVATELLGVSGELIIDQTTHDRSQEFVLVNHRRVSPPPGSEATGEESFEVVDVGAVPDEPSPESMRGNLPWLNRSIQWPGGAVSRTAPGDGISVAEISVATLLGLSQPLGRVLFCAARLAEMHVNARDGRVVGELAHLTNDFRFQLRPYPTNSTISGGVAAFEAALATHHADCLLGAQFSSISAAVASRSRGLPQVCPTSSSDYLSDKALYPGFARTHPTNAQAAQALVTLLRTSFWSWSAIGIVSVSDAYGSSYAQGIREAVATHGRGMRLVASVTFMPNDVESMSRAMDRLYGSGVSVVVCISHEDDLAALLARAGELLANDFAWIVVDAADDVVARVEAGEMSAAYARHLNGMLAFQFDTKPRHEDSTPRMALEAVYREAGPSLGCSSTGELPSYAPLVYDAVAALAIAVNNSVDKRRAAEVVANLRQVSMAGASGMVQMSQTGDRMLAGTAFQLSNFQHRPSSAAALQVPKVLNFFPDDGGANASGTAATFANGSDACPCIHAFPSVLPTDSSGRLVSIVDGATAYLPPNFGIGTCDLHDMAMPACQSARNPPSWCYDHWCYVDPDQCTGLTSRSTYFDYVGANLSYSHATCSRSILSVGDITWKGGVGAMPVDLSALGCPAGYESRMSEDGVRRCAACPSGRFKPYRAHATCQSCLPGSFQPMAGAASCSPCPMGTYQRAHEATSCDVCPENRRPSQTNGSTMCICEVGFFEDYDSSEPTCERCGVGLDCLRPGMTRSGLTLSVGYWRPSSDSLDVRRCTDSGMNCTNQGACAASTSGCRGGSDPNASCAATLDGPLCQLCAPSNVSVFYEPAWEGFMARCAPCGGLVAGTIGVVIAVIAALLLLVSLTRYCAAKGLQQETLERLWRLWLACKLESSLKICIGFYQIVTRIPDVYEVSLTNELRMILSYFTLAISLNLGSVSDLLTCLGLDGYFARLFFWFCVPPVLIVVVLLGSFAHMLARGTPPTAHRLFESATPPILRGLFLVYPLIANVAFEAFSCHDFEGNPLIVDVRIACYTDEYYSGVFTLAIAAVSFWAFGLVIVNGTFLVCARKDLLRHRETTFTKAVGFLHADYDPSFYWWELVEMLRRLLLVGIFVLFRRGSITQLFVATIFTAFYALVQVQANPYNDMYSNFLATCSSFLLLGTFLSCIIMETGSWTELPLVQALMTPEQRDDLSVPAASLTVAMMLCCFGSLFLLVWVTGLRLHDEREKHLNELESLTGNGLLRDKETGKRVALPPIVDDKKYDFFLSHAWAHGGQDVMRVLKQRLLSMLPGVEIFLDVDDLEDVGKIPEMICCSRLMVVFCTEQYFNSRSCIRELIAATLNGVRIIALLETDKKHGAFSVDEVREGLLAIGTRYEEWDFCGFDPATTPSGQALFDHLMAHKPIEWNRARHFRDVSMSLIAERLVGLEGTTYTNRDLSRHPLRPPPPPTGRHHIYCSDHNPGAAKLVAEIADAHALQLTMATDESARPHTTLTRQLTRKLTARLVSSKGPVLLASSSHLEMPRSDHYLLYLNGQTWTRGDDSKALEAEVHEAIDSHVHLLLAHEVAGLGQEERHGVDFDTIIKTTPQSLLAKKVYHEVAVGLRGGPWRPTSMIHLGLALKMTSDVAMEQEELQRSAKKQRRKSSTVMGESLERTLFDEEAPKGKARSSWLGSSSMSLTSRASAQQPADPVRVARVEVVVDGDENGSADAVNVADVRVLR